MEHAEVALQEASVTKRQRWSDEDGGDLEHDALPLEEMVDVRLYRAECDCGWVRVWHDRSALLGLCDDHDAHTPIQIDDESPTWTLAELIDAAAADLSALGELQMQARW